MRSATAVWYRALARIERRKALPAGPTRDRLVREACRTANLIYPFPPNYRQRRKRAA